MNLVVERYLYLAKVVVVVELSYIQSVYVKNMSL